jgi:hypothetical protein
LKLFVKHSETNKHIKKSESFADGASNQLAKENTNKFICEICDFKCSKNSYWHRHIITAKHIRLTNVNINVSPEDETSKYCCAVCCKVYRSRVGLWKHSKKCKPAPAPPPAPEPHKSIFITELPDNNTSLTLMVVELMKSNQELQKQMLELCKNNSNNINSNNNHNNNNNKTFNMQFFLNEQCKDAMNIMEFVDTFKLDFSDLERVGEIGYVESMSNIIIQKLNEMDIYKRPIHCSDVKRETLYVKDKNVWEKENGTHDKLRLAIRYIGKKNTDLLNKWCDAHPGSKDSDNYLNDIYMEMVMQAMGGRGDREDNENKIMRKIARSVLIDKDMS